MKDPDNKKLTLSYKDKAKSEPEQGIILFSLPFISFISER